MTISAPPLTTPEEAALSYLRRGWSVVPIKTGDKAALIPWTEFQSRRASEEEVRGWYKRWPDAGVGVVAGAISGLVVFDRDGEKGLENLRARGVTAYPDTPRASTRRGEHVFFQHPGFPVSSQSHTEGAAEKGLIPWDRVGLEWKGDGGYVVAAPTMHADGAVRYAWEVSPEEAELADLPDWFLELYAEAKAAGNGAPVEVHPVDMAAADYVPEDMGGDSFASAYDEERENMSKNAQEDALANTHPARVALDTPYTLERWRAELQQLAEGVPTGFDALDELGMQWLPGKLYGIIARPGAGKTALLLEATLRYLENNPDKTALFLSWEEPLADLFARLMLRMDATRTRQSNSFAGAPIFAGTVRTFGRDANVDASDTSGGTFAVRLAAAAYSLEHILPRLRLVDGDELGRDTHAVLREVAAWMRTEAEREDGARVGLVAVDYFQKLRTGDAYATRQRELQSVADTLRRFAKGAALTGGSDAPDANDPRFAVPVIVGAQVNRSAVAEEHPTGDQIREADDLLNDAAAVLALSWELVNNGGGDDELRSLRVSVPKHRGGQTRPEKVARFAWHPARHWIAPGAVRENTTGPITWSKPEKKDAQNGAANTTAPRLASEVDYQ